MRRKSFAAAAGLAMLLTAAPALSMFAATARADDVPSADDPRAEAKRWFRNAKFGMFVHWGVYSLLGRGEWVMNNDKIPISEYEKLPPRFNPTKFDAAAWVSTVKRAGMKYITITSKHNDGFCMYDSKLTKYDIVDGTPYGKDPLKALADACHKEGVKLFFYYSLLDWHHPDYFPRGGTGKTAGRAEEGDWKKYVAYYQGQVRELCTNYGEIGGIWFDGWWDRPRADWDLEGTYRIIHELQPKALAGNNHHVKPFPGEDFQMFEQDLPGENSAGFNKAQADAGLPLETCLTMNNSWGYNAGDKKFKSADQVIRTLVGAAGRNANLLLNVGPRPDGTIGREFEERLGEVGRWLDANGQSIYATRRGPYGPAAWGVSTQSASSATIFLHVLKDVDEVELPRSALDLAADTIDTHKPFMITTKAGAAAIAIPQDVRKPVDTIIVLTPNVLRKEPRRREP